MAYDNHSNLACSKITAVPVDPVNGTAFNVVADDGQLFSPNQPVTMWPDGITPSHDNAEIGYITAVSGDTLTITRAQEGTQAFSVAVGWNIAATLTAKTLTDIEEVVALKVDQVPGKSLSTNDYTTPEKTKLSGIASGATQNASDAALRDRTTHTGSQAIATVTGLQTALDGKADASALTSHTSNVSNPHSVTKAQVGLSNVDNTSDVNKPISTATQTALDDKTSKDYLASHGAINLITNGQAMIGTNYNFSSFTLDKTDHPTGAAGSFYPNAVAGSRVLDEFLPVNPARTYEMAFAMRQAAGDGARRFYSRLAPYDADKLSIQPYHFMEQANTRTTLAAALNPGDTTVTLTSATNWNNAAGASTWLRSFIFWNYTDGQGYAWPTGTYSRNWFGDIYADGAISGNVITLRTAWAGPAIANGTSVSNGSSGGAYMYGASNILGPATWTNYGPYRYSGVHSDNTLAATTAFPVATSYVKAGFLVHYPTGTPDPTSVQKFANLAFTDTTSSDDKLKKTGDTMTGNLTLNDAVNVVTGTTTGTKVGTATTQKLGFFNATPVVQQSATTDLGTTLSNLGFRASGTNYPITTSGGVTYTGSVREGPGTITATSTLTVSSAKNQRVSATGSTAINVTLPATTSAGYRFRFYRTDANAAVVTLLGTINGNASGYVLSAQYKYVDLMSTTTSGTWEVWGNN